MNAVCNRNIGNSHFAAAVSTVNFNAVNICLCAGSINTVAGITYFSRNVKNIAVCICNSISLKNNIILAGIAEKG